MSAAVVRPPAWDGVDFSHDFRLRILNGVIPLIFASVSFGILFLSWFVKRVYKAVKRRRRRQRMHRVGNPPSLLTGGSSTSSPSHGRPNIKNNGQYGAASSSHHHLRAARSSADDHSRRSIASSIGGHSDDGDATASNASAVPLPQVIIETEAEHDAADSHDLMFEAENAVIRAQVKEQGIVWPGAFKALGMLKEKEDHHHKPTVLPRRYLAIPGDGQVHDSDSWIQWWKDPRKKMSKKLGFFARRSAGHGRSSRGHKRGRRRAWTWRALGKKLIKQGRKDFIQALLAWSIVAVFFVKAAFASNVRSPWKWVPGIVWTYFTLLMEVRQYTALLHRSPFRTRKYDRLSYHINFFILGMMLLSLLELRSIVIQHHFHHDDGTVGLQSTIAALGIIVFLMEVLTPRPSNFIRKTRLLEERARSPSFDAERRSVSPADSDEREQLLPSSQHHDDEGSSDDDEDMDEEEEMLLALDLMPDDLEEEKEREKKINVIPPLDVGVSIFSLATYTYIGNFLFKHARTLATFSDVPDLRADDKSASVVLEFRASCRSYPRWLRKRTKSGLRKRPPIFLQICWYFLPELAGLMSWAFLTPFLSVLPSLFINFLLNWTTARAKGADAQAHVAVLYIAGMFCSQMAVSMTRSRSLIMGRRLCIRAKALVITEVFTKALRRKDLAGKALVEGLKDPKSGDAGKEDEGPATAGRIQNLVSVDATRISEMFAYTHFFFPEGPFTIIIATAMLFRTIGFSAFAAIGAMLCLGPYQSRVAQLFMRFQNQVLQAADERLSLSTEVFQAIKVLKFFAWERKFAEKLDQKREAEVAALKRRVLVFAAGGMMLFGAPVLIALVTFIFHTKVFHQPLTAATAFTALALFNVIRAPIEMLADMASQLMSAIVSCSRVDKLLDEEETAKYAIVATPKTASDPKIGFVNASFTWADADAALNDSSTFRLKNLNLTFVIDGLNLVVGPVGSGKSSLLYALLGEMNLLNGKCFLPSPIVRDAGRDPADELTETVAFCSQTPWLLNDTIRNNILFGCTYNARRYRRVLQACALVPDIEVLELGDRTEVGEKGTVLSGGQKARISLARAIYSSAKVILLDDVLSAVDAHTARHLYNNCLTSDKLMRGRTRILVTHALHLTIPLADYMVALANGYVVFDGPAHDYILASGANTPGLATGQDFSGLSLKGFEKDIEKKLLPTERLEEAAADQAFEHTLLNHDENPLSQETMLAKAEKQDTGAVGFGVYTFYGKAFGSLPVIAAVVAVITLTEVCAVSTNWSLRLWASSFDNLTTELRKVFVSLTTDVAPHEPDYYLKRYATLAAVSLVLFGGRMLFFLWRGTVASKVIYHDVMKTLLAAPVRFYDTTPLGRIMNRLSSDMETVDQDVPSSLLFFTLEVFATLSVLVAIAIALPAFLIAGAFISLAYLLLGWLYISSSRELKRIEAVTRSPVYSLVGESLLGVTSIRAYSDASRFTSKLFNLIDDTNRPFIALWHTNRWLSVRSDLGGACFALATASFIVATKNVSASLAGFALTYALIMEERILWIVRLYASSQIAMNSVERVREYTLELAQEPQGGKEPPAYWPSNQAGIQVEKLAIRYSESLPLALKGVSFEIKPSERVAIVGRTGSGKSTLALSFFRFVEASGGRIVIDGVDIGSIPLHTLRDRLTIIPQDAALFSGTVRFNLDPFEQYSDAELYDVLRRTNLLNTKNRSGAATPVRRQHSTSGQAAQGHINATSGSKGSGNGHGHGQQGSGMDLTKTSGISSLDDKVQEGAKNFSAGQRQLLCLARGLLKLRNSNVLVLDESTANLDHETDVAVQAAIREEIGDKSVTVLCIAHRLHTIIDFDRVLVLSNGEVLEYDTPSKLLSNGEEGSEFARLCKESGDFERLKEMADEHASGAGQ